MHQLLLRFSGRRAAQISSLWGMLVEFAIEKGAGRTIVSISVCGFREYQMVEKWTNRHGMYSLFTLQIYVHCIEDVS